MSTNIQWAEETWNPTVGCSKVSSGCEHCYAIRMANRLQSNPKTKDLYKGTVTKTKGGKLNWTGKINLNYEALQIPSKWKKPRRIFVGSMSDIFHPKVSFSDRLSIWIEMMLNNHHNYLVLTKRPEIAKSFLERLYGINSKRESFFQPNRFNHVWIGTSVENQEQADKRIPELLQIPAAVRFLSCEPLLGEINLRRISLNGDIQTSINVLNGRSRFSKDIPDYPHVIDWVIAGGESGPGARPLHPDWLRSLRDQCLRYQTPFFFKQWGDYVPFQDTYPPYVEACSSGELHDRHTISFTENGDPSIGGKWAGHRFMSIDDTMSYHMNEPDRLDVNYLKVGKHKAGRLLDGKEHNEYPQT